MPRQTPVLDYSQIRNYTERWQWLDPNTGHVTTGFNPPPFAINKEHVPFSILFLTEQGIPYRGRAVCIGVNNARRTRRLQFITDAVYALAKEPQSIAQHKVIAQGEVRQVSDLLIVEVDGVRFAAS